MWFWVIFYECLKHAKKWGDYYGDQWTHYNIYLTAVDLRLYQSATVSYCYLKCIPTKSFIFMVHYILHVCILRHRKRLSLSYTELSDEMAF